MNKKLLSKAFLGGAVGIPFYALISYVTNQDGIDSNIEREMYIYMGIFFVSILLHLFFRDESLDKFEVISIISRLMFGLLPAIFFFSLFSGSYVIMFMSLGLFVLFYLIHLLVGFIKKTTSNND